MLILAIKEVKIEFFNCLDGFMCRLGKFFWDLGLFIVIAIHILYIYW